MAYIKRFATQTDVVALNQILNSTRCQSKWSIKTLLLLWDICPAALSHIGTVLSHGADLKRYIYSCHKDHCLDKGLLSLLTQNPSIQVHNLVSRTFAPMQGSLLNLIILLLPEHARLQRYAAHRRHRYAFGSFFYRFAVLVLRGCFNLDLAPVVSRIVRPLTIVPSGRAVCTTKSDQFHPYSFLLFVRRQKRISRYLCRICCCYIATWPHDLRNLLQILSWVGDMQQNLMCVDDIEGAFLECIE